MIQFILYVFVALTIYYILSNKYEDKLEEYVESSMMNIKMESKYFWIPILTSAFWIIGLPIYLFWELLERTIGKKYFNK